MVWTTQFEAQAGRFLWSRLVRIYGGYMPIALVFLAFKAATTGTEYWIPDGLDLAGSLSLVTVTQTKLLIYPTWSLTFELLFYLAFAYCLLFGKRWFLANILLVGLVLYAVGSSGLCSTAQTWLFTSPMNLLFLLGIIVGVMAVNGAALRGSVFWPAIAIAVVGFSYGFWNGIDQAPLHRIMGFGCGTAALILVLVRLETRGAIPDLPALCRIGDASYAIYLIHAPLMFVMATRHLNAPLANLLGPYFMLSVFLGLLLLLSLTYFRFVERPLNGIGRRVFANLFPARQRLASNSRT